MLGIVGFLNRVSHGLDKITWKIKAIIEKPYKNIAMSMGIMNKTSSEQPNNINIPHPKERADYGALVEQLGGRVSDASTYDKNCTHLVVGKSFRISNYN